MECLAQAGGFDKESQKGAGEGYEEDIEEEDEEKEGEEEDRMNDPESVERAKGKSRAKRMRVISGEGVASTRRSCRMACMPNVRLSDQ